MIVVNYTSHYLTILRALCLLVPAAMAGCACQVGREVVIPSADNTEPAIVLDFHLPNGQTLSASPNSVPSTVTVPGGGTVTVIAKASDDQGIKDVQLWIGTETCSYDPNNETESCVLPGLQTGPSASNRDTKTAGQSGCSERLVKQNLKVHNTPNGRVSHEVVAKGVNFGGREVRIPLIRLEAQPVRALKVTVSPGVVTANIPQTFTVNISDSLSGVEVTKGDVFINNNKIGKVGEALTTTFIAKLIPGRCHTVPAECDDSIPPNCTKPHDECDSPEWVVDPYRVQVQSPGYLNTVVPLQVEAP
jgi:hypothetical protein